MDCCRTHCRVSRPAETRSQSACRSSPFSSCCPSGCNLLDIDICSQFLCTKSGQRKRGGTSRTFCKLLICVHRRQTRPNPPGAKWSRISEWTNGSSEWQQKGCGYAPRPVAPRWVQPTYPVTKPYSSSSGHQSGGRALKSYPQSLCRLLECF